MKAIFMVDMPKSCLECEFCGYIADIEDGFRSCFLNKHCFEERDVEEVPDEYYLDEVLLDFTLDEYEEEVNSLPKSVINRLLDRAIILYKQGEFSNFNKMSLLEKKLGIEYVFEDIDRSMRPVRSDIDLL